MLLILFSLLLSLGSAQAYTEMALKPVHIKNKNFNQMQLGRTYNYYNGSRILAAKEASFPILEQYEKLLFPQRDFSKEKAKARLERIEIAVHGDIQRGSIKHRLNLLENEVSAWQIANYQTLQILDTKQKNPNAFAYQSSRQTRMSRAPVVRRQAPVIQSSMIQANISPAQQKRQVDYDYENYRTANPLIRDIGRRSIRALFDL